MNRGKEHHSLIFVRENEGQLTGSDCCGKLEGDWRFERGRSIFTRQRGVLTRLAPLFLLVQQRYRERFEIHQVDPRNQLFLFPKLFVQIWQRRRFSFAAFRSLFMLYRLPAIIIDGELKYSGKVPSQSEFIALLNRTLGE